MFRRRFVALVGAVSFGALLAVAHAADNSQYAGTYSGTWEGAGGAGKFEMTLTVGTDGQLAGGVSVGSDQGDYTAKFTSLTLADGKLKAKYDYTPDTQAEIALSASVSGGVVSGEWLMLPKGQEQALANGTWKVSKK